MKENINQIILDNENVDLHSFSLNLSKQNQSNKDFIIRQISGRKKVKYKIPSFYNTIEIQYPLNLSVEQSSSEQTSIYKSSLVEGENFIDLTGGFGVDFAFISRKFQKSTYVERQSELCKIAEHNFKVLGIDNFEIINLDSIEYLKQINYVDLIYLDPHRRSKTGNKTFQIADCEPNLNEIMDELMSKSKICMVKLSPMLDIQLALKDLKYAFEIHIISVDNECKELVFLNSLLPSSNVKIQTVNFQKSGKIQHLEYDITEEKLASATIKSISNYLYEPNSSILKAGAFKLISKRFNIDKLNINTHIYTSAELIENFPGRSFEIIDVKPYNKETIRSISSKYPKANISTRNFPLKAEEIRKKTKIIEGGEIYIFACRDNQEESQLIICRKI